ncbi:amino acid adenylation domain-containing protein [Bradyrhizobium sp. 44]|jgi:amino acid adenylation domain-containing protein|uniref:amino acid adenylation domain-containing protein n=1 Tax=Bradyrhizobium sp. 44 TaxID=2782675 RepID=UPI001FF7B8D9|nr:amino acid adenylation domain-containing protein [Bradyrhizobium sp. 44]MCK1284316.1 amino acid adenylation domain-containing protein [Bradyrhizobium sp. 44]
MAWAEANSLARGMDPQLSLPSSCETLSRAFEQQAARTPGGVAVQLGDDCLTYRQLDQRSNQLARTLRKHDLPSDGLVAVCFERSLDLIVSILAVLKAGVAYLPIDPSYPVERISMILEDAEPSVFLTQDALAQKVARQDSGSVVCVDRDHRIIAEEDAGRLDDDASADNLAYVIYTSGSTGRPKGVMVTHRNALRLFASTAHWFDFGPSDVWTLFHSSAFDFSVWEIWGCLLTGGRLVCVPHLVVRSPIDFHKLLVDEQVTVLSQTPAAFYQLLQVEEASTAEALKLRYVVFGGEALNFANLRPWFERHGDRTPQLINMYGITETTVHVTYRPVTLNDALNETRSLIGVPIPDLRIYLLDSELCAVAVGDVGEIYVGGAGVARGYLNRPELTAERFVRDPFVLDSPALMYKSGDLARATETGDLEYLGRGDSQVKIRGYRIELGEIEAILADHRSVAQAVVMARRDGPGEPKLVAYFVRKKPSASTTAEDLREFLKTRLPAHMVPYAYEQLEALPLTINGKVDRAALPAPRTNDNVEIDSTLMPMEKQIKEIWCEVLGTRSVGADDNFFDVGGDSLLLANVHGRMQRALCLEIPVTDLFEFTTIRTLARRLKESSSPENLLVEAQQRAQKQRAALGRKREFRRSDAS